MVSAIIAFVVALASVLTLTPQARKLALKLNAVDRPGGRRINERPIPRMGGLAVAASFFISLLTLYVLDTNVAGRFFADSQRIIGLFAGGAVMATVGAWDDVRGVRAIHKLAAQLLAAAIAYANGFRIEALSLPLLPSIELGIMSPVLTTIWIVVVVNAINLIDGLDGLAAGVAFFACVSNFFIGMMGGDAMVMLVSASLAGAAVGFLFFNFNPASIFMGDTGSLFVGYILATTSIMSSSVKSSTTVAILAPLLALGLPIMDTLLAIVRRVLARRSIFLADRGHIHHFLLGLGLTHRRAVVTLYSLCAFLTFGAISIALTRDRQQGLSLLLICMVAIGVVGAATVLQQSVKRSQKQERGWPEAVDAMRAFVPDALFRLRAAENLDDVGDVMSDLVKQPPMRGVILEDCEDPSLQALSRGRETTPLDEDDRNVVSVSFPLPTADAGRIKFIWANDEPALSTPADVLLQLVADAFGDALARTGFKPVATATSQAPQAAPVGASSVRSELLSPPRATSMLAAMGGRGSE